MLVRSWPHADRRMSIEVLRGMYDVRRYRVAEYFYPAGTAFVGRTRAVTWYILSGVCRARAHEEVLLREGDVAEIDATEYSLFVHSDLKFVAVWDLAPHMN